MTAFDAMLSRLESIRPIPDAEKRKLRTMAQPRRLAKGDFLFKSGDRTLDSAFMHRGLLRYFYVSVDGKEYTKHFCLGGNFVVSLQGLFTDHKAAYSTQAMEDSELITFRSADWSALMRGDPIWGFINYTLLGEAMMFAEARERSLVLDPAPRRYEKFLRDYPGLESRVKQYDVASYLGITPIALSRIRKKMGISLTRVND